MEKVYVPKTSEEKSMQRALLQYFRPENKPLIIKALKRANRLDLIGNSPKCLVREDFKPSNSNRSTGGKTWERRSKNGSTKGSSVKRKKR